jgi:hypothetical protein
LTTWKITGILCLTPLVTGAMAALNRFLWRWLEGHLMPFLEDFKPDVNMRISPW